jgi:diguanylate cyclase (GGDEF)-like protein
LLQLHEVRLRLSRWRLENDAVADLAVSVNLDRVRWIAPIVAGLNGLHALVFLGVLLFKSPGGVAYTWTWGLLLTHLGMGCTMAAFAFAARHYRYASRHAAVRTMGLGLVAAGMAFSILVVTVDQLVTPNITPFLITCMISALVIYLRPMATVALYAIAYAGFFIALGYTQGNADQLLSNRLNGAAACAMGCALSVFLWRKFTLITEQQRQLEKANATLQQKQKELERLTRLDGLTGLYNRNTFVELTRQELMRAQRQGSATAILLFDLDHFKRVNDTWGHPAGDAVLKHVADLANSTVRSTDLVGRLGGEEFMVLLPGTSEGAARKLAEKLRSRLEASPVVWESTNITATASFGLAATTAAEKRDFETLYNDADKALYLAKQRGRNRVV